MIVMTIQLFCVFGTKWCCIHGWMEFSGYMTWSTKPVRSRELWITDSSSELIDCYLTGTSGITSSLKQMWKSECVHIALSWKVKKGTKCLINQLSNQQNQSVAQPQSMEDNKGHMWKIGTSFHFLKFWQWNSNLILRFLQNSEIFLFLRI